ncbi:MAG: hypothetical protein RKE49_07480 [Oceanicaulis sp.]
MVKLKTLMMEGAGAGCLALSGLAAIPAVGALLTGVGAILPALRNAVADKDKAAVEAAVQRIVAHALLKQAREQQTALRKEQ